MNHTNIRRENTQIVAKNQVILNRGLYRWAAPRSVFVRGPVNYRFQDLQRLPLSFINSVRGRCQIKFGMTTLFNNGGFTARSVTPQCRYAGYSGHPGFTLIELLVVVLIIGILAAVALPQYNKAVIKSRNAEMKQVVKAVANAEHVYFLANGKYAYNFNELDLELPLTPVKITSVPNYTTGDCSVSAAGTDPIRQNQDYYVVLNSQGPDAWMNVVAYWRRGPYKCAGFGISFLNSELGELHCRERSTGGFYTAGADKFCKNIEQAIPINIPDPNWRFYSLP